MEGVGLILSVTLSCFVKDNIRALFLTPSLCISPDLHRLRSDSNRQSGLLNIFLILSFLFLSPFFVPSSSPCLLCLSLSLSDGAYQQQNKQAHCVLREPSERQRGGLFHSNLDRISIHRGDGGASGDS